jgi:prepilin-type N-terminal cleavage/methylation domain-containing protein
VIKITKNNSHKGFTLVEVLIAAALTGVIGLGMVGLQSILSRSQVLTFQSYLNVDETNSAVTSLVREIRNTRPSDSGTYPLVTAQDQNLVFYSDIDFDGKTEKVRYSLVGKRLERGVIEPIGYPAAYPPENETVKLISEYIRNGTDPIFYYYNGDWPADTDNNPLTLPVRLSDTKLMKVYLELNSESGNNADNFILESYVQIRMLKENL